MTVVPHIISSAACHDETNFPSLVPFAKYESAHIALESLSKLNPWSGLLTWLISANLVQRMSIRVEMMIDFLPTPDASADRCEGWAVIEPELAPPSTFVSPTGQQAERTFDDAKRRE